MTEPKVEVKPKYFGRVIKEEATKPGCWNYLNVGVYENLEDGTEKQVGSYQRKYSSLYDTFHAFKQKGKWYALYSSDYTCTSVMSLPDCKQIATEAGSASGFCPTGFYVPTKEDFSHGDTSKYDWHAGHRSEEHYEKLAKSMGQEHSDKWRKWDKETDNSYSDVENLYEGQCGFVSGCYWGDDSSWKLQYLDLSKITEGIIKREDRWGYWELPEGKSIKECINFEEIELPSFTQVKVLKEQTLPILDRDWTGKKVGEVYWFNDDSIFNGLRVKIKQVQLESHLCEVIYSNNKVKDTDVWIEDHYFRYAKPQKAETNWDVIKRKIKYLFKGVV